MIERQVESKTDPKTLYQQELKAYEETIDKIEKETKQAVTSLERHVLLFLDENKTFSPATVTAGLTLLHSHQPGMKGPLIATFNATHGSNNVVCPALSAQFIKDKNGYARFLHLGTTRIWNADGTINEDRLNQFKTAVTAGQDASQKIVTLSQLNAYLAQCLATDPATSENGSGRNADAKFGLSSKKLRENAQASAATSAWSEVFDRLACGWIKNSSGALEPYMTLEITEEFFRDSPRAFLRAKCGLLPVPKPEPQVEKTHHTGTLFCPYARKTPVVASEEKQQTVLALTSP